MSIKSIGDMSKTLQTYDAQNWSSKAGVKRGDIETGSTIEFENFDKMTQQNLQQGSNAEGSQSFGDFLKESLSKVNSLQQDANVAIEKLATGEEQSIHETLIAVEKAELAFKTMNQLRQKVIDAYREIMRIQI